MTRARRARHLGALIAATVGACHGRSAPIRPPSDAAGDSGPPPVVVDVVPVYPANSDWMDYVKNDDPAVDRFHQDDVACVSADDRDTKLHACVHGGVLRQVTVSPIADCDTHSIRDRLGLWRWHCDDHGGAGPVEFFSEDFQRGRGLRHLLDASTMQFRSNGVEIIHDASGRVVAVSEPAVWGWSGNTVLDLPANTSADSVILDDAEKNIYVAGASMETSGYAIQIDRTAIVTLEGVTLTKSTADSLNCTRNDADSGVYDQRCMIVTRGESFHWLEVVVNGDAPDSANDAHYGIHAMNSYFMRIHLSEVSGTAQGSDMWGGGVITPGDAANNVVSELAVHHNADAGFDVTCCSGDYSVYRDIVAYNNGADGVGFARMRYSVAHDILTVKNGDAGLVVSSAGRRSRVFNVVSIANRGNGFFLNADESFYVNLVAAGNELAGVRLWETTTPNLFDNTLVNILSVSNGGAGLQYQWGIRNTMVQALSALNVGSGLSAGIDGESPTAFNTNVNIVSIGNGNRSLTDAGDVGSTGNRYVDFTAAIAHGFENIWMARPGHAFEGAVRMDVPTCASRTSDDSVFEGTCTSDGADGSSSWPVGGASTATLRTGLDVTASFVGRATSDDTSTVEDPNGRVDSTVLDVDYTRWASFDNPFRTWTTADPGMFTATQVDSCRGALCQIFDWRLRANDTALRAVYGEFSAGLPCPASVHGNNFVEDQQQYPHYPGINAVENGGDGDGSCESGEVCKNRFLASAIEIVLDDVGDDDGLCESQETCIVSPNLGYYQGEGNAVANGACLFQDGTISGVTMFGYPVNGR